MKNSQLQDEGFTHSVVVLAVVVLIAIGLVFTMVWRRHSSNSVTHASANNTSKSQVASNNATTAQSASTQSQPATATGSTTNASSSSKPKSSTSSSSSSSSSATPAAQATTQTPLSALTTLITNLKNGSQVNVTASAVSVAGPITTAQARPIVFTANGQTYFAYRQGQAADFTQSPSVIAGTMAITSASGNPSLVSAHLDKSANLVDPSISGTLVGYSQGGN